MLGHKAKKRGVGYWSALAIGAVVTVIAYILLITVVIPFVLLFTLFAKWFGVDTLEGAEKRSVHRWQLQRKSTS